MSSPCQSLEWNFTRTNYHSYRLQCANKTLSWSPTKAPYDVEVYTNCADPNMDPMYVCCFTCLVVSFPGLPIDPFTVSLSATFSQVPGNSVFWYANVLSGSGIFFAVTDADGVDYFSDDVSCITFLVMRVKVNVS